MSGIRYRIEYSKDASDNIKKFPKNIQERIIKAIDERLSFTPEIGKPLVREWKNHRRLRECLFSIYPRKTYTNCQETVEGHPGCCYQVAVGGFSSVCLDVCINNTEYDFIGVAALRKFF